MQRIMNGLAPPENHTHSRIPEVPADSKKREYSQNFQINTSCSLLAPEKQVERRHQMHLLSDRRSFQFPNESNIQAPNDQQQKHVFSPIQINNLKISEPYEKKPTISINKKYIDESQRTEEKNSNMYQHVFLPNVSKPHSEHESSERSEASASI